MKPVLLIGSLLAAAIAGAAGAYLILQPLAGGPGNGAMTCPGNAACPAENRTSGGPNFKKFHGIAIPSAEVTNGNFLICEGVATSAGCPDKYVGILRRTQTGDKALLRCSNGTGKCRTVDGVTYDALYCENDNTTWGKPGKACPALPLVTDPRW